MKKGSILPGSIIFIIVFLYSYYGRSQMQQDPKIQNPNAASLGLFGEIPLGLFTGSPNITIPIHTLTFGKINVPISLRYHPSSVKPSAHPGWVGLGWNLESYGRITRTARGSFTGFELIDELHWPDQPDGGLNDADTYYPAPAGDYNGTGSSGSEKVNVSNWDSPSRLQDYFTVSSPIYPVGRPFVDVQADEFSFNFGNYSGKFYYEGPQNGWQVASTANIKVELNDFSNGNFFLTKNEIYGGIAQFHQFGPNYPSLDQGHQSRMFKGFTITVEDGTKYVFGGADAVEFHCQYGVPGQGNLFYVDNWLLKKIVDIYGNEVTFEYRRNYPTVNLSFGQTDVWGSATSGSTTWPCTSGTGFTNAVVNAKRHGGILQWPMYLNKITCPVGSVEFLASVATCLRYTDVQLTQIVEGNGTANNLFDLTLLAANWNLPSDPANVNNLQWEKLDWIVIKNAKQEVLKKFNFYYQPTTTTGQRLTLNSVTELDASTMANGTFTFTYNGIADLPNYFGDYTDHWGHFNNRTVHQMNLTEILANNTKATDINYVTKGLLTSIKWPTGGSTSFTWEPHDYSAFVSLSRNALETATGYAGGSRVSRIQSISAEGVLLSDKKYFYKKNYVSSAQVSSLTSSGVLNGKPKYHLTLTNRPTLDNAATFNLSFVSLNSLSTYSYNAQGSHIGYDEVVEVNSDGSYTKSYFTSYGTDLNGVSHYDKLPGLIGWQPIDDPYIPMNSLELERGLPVGTYKYNNRDILVQKKTITYRNDEARFNSFVKRIDLSHIYACNPGWGALILAVAKKEYSYVYYPVKTEVIDFDADGKTSVTSVITSVYNSFNAVSQTEETDSRGVKHITTYKYPYDFPSDPTLTAMANAHIFSPLIESTKSANLPVSTPLTSSKTNYYSPSPGIFTPSNTQAQKGTNPIETVQQFQFDAKGNVVEMQKANDLKEVYVWGYSGQYAVAKIIGSDLSTINSLITPSMQTTITNTGLIYSDADVRTALQNIRTALLSSKALVTTYTYAPGVGMTSETDPNGNTVYYEYDSFGRLQTMKDRNGNVVKTYDYHYKQ